MQHEKVQQGPQKHNRRATPRNVRSRGGEQNPEIGLNPLMPEAPTASESADPVGTQGGEQLNSTNGVDSSTHYGAVQQYKNLKNAKAGAFAPESVKF